MNFRQISAAERTATMFPLQAYAFMPSPWPAEDEEINAQRMKFFESAVSLVAEEDGQALAAVAAFRMRQNVRGRLHDMAGVASVSSHPSARRRGLVRELMQRLLRQMRDEGCAVSVLYPFRAGFYARFGFVGIPRYRTAAFAPEGLDHLLHAELPGEVTWLPMSEAFDEWDGLQRHLLTRRHGFAVFDEVRAAEFRDDKYWVAVARSGGEVVGAVRYRIKSYGGDLIADHLLCANSIGRALLLQFFARHVDQVSRVVVKISTDEVPELWGTDIQVVTEGKVDRPSHGGPMVRVLDMEALNGAAVGPGAITVEIPDDELIGGVWRLESVDGVLAVTKGTTGTDRTTRTDRTTVTEGTAVTDGTTVMDGTAVTDRTMPAATLSVGGFSALLYGVLDPVEVVTRGLGEIPPEAVPTLAAMFPREMLYLVADF